MKQKMKRISTPNKPFRSIGFKIMLVLLITTSIFSGVVLVLNATLLREAREKVIFDQLRASAVAQRAHERSQSDGEQIEDSLWAAHFLIEYESGVMLTGKERFRHGEAGDETVIQAIGNAVMKLPKDADTGELHFNNQSYFFYREWLETDRKAMVFYVSQDEYPLVNRSMMGFFIAAILIGLITARIIANGIARQVKALDSFAESIANRQWDASVPKTDQDEIGLLAASLVKTRDALRAAEERDRQFLQSTSHDLKTPVMLIKGYAQAILDGVSVSSKQSHAEVILGEAEKLEKRIVQLLRLNTLDQALSYVDEWEDIRLDRLLKSVVEKFKGLSPELKWLVKLDEKTVKGNSEALLIAFENLLDNQCRYAKHAIYVSLREGVIEISNDGPPFHTEDFNSLFNPHVKDESGKFGLGLAIVHKVITGHGWQIKAENLANGVSFVIQMKVGDAYAD